jgi:spore germination protein KC
MKLKRLLFIHIILSILLLAGCWSSHEVNTLAITVCTGIDKTEKGYLITEQVINPRAIASTKMTSESPVFLFTKEGENLDEIIRSFSTQTSRTIYNAHLRMVVFGEEVARDGIQNILDYFIRNYQYRTDFYFVVAKNTTANEVLSVLTPLESIPGIDLYNSLKESEENWAPTKSIRIVELVNSILADGKNPVITGVEVTKGENISNSTDALKASNEIKKTIFTGMGAFKKDKLAGWLDEDESKGYNYIIGNVKRTVGYANYGDKVKVANEVINAKSVMKASIEKGRPVVNVEIDIKQNVGAVEGEFDVSREENIKIINETSEKKIKSICEKTVRKVQNELKTDIFGFGEAIHRKYPKLWEKMKDNWNNEFPDLAVNITVRVKTNQLGQITKPLFMKEKE